MNKTASTELSVVIPVYNEEAVLESLVKEQNNVLDSLGHPYELIFVDDGSEDSTWDILKNLERSRSLRNIRAVKFTRNFGKEAAIRAGLQMARGKAAILMDADLQHPPDLLPKMISLWRSEGYAVVEGVKSFRQKESVINRLGSLFFYKILRILTGFDIHKDTDYKLLDRRVVHIYLSLNERSRFFRALIPFLGFKTARVTFKPNERKTGQTKYPIPRLSNLALTAITSFSSLPLHIVTLLGVLTLVFSLLLGIQTVYMKLSGKAIEGFTTVILLLLVIGSILMIALGIIGEYIARIFEEVKGRPPFVVDETLNIENKEKFLK